VSDLPRLKLKMVAVELDPFLFRGLCEMADARGERVSNTLRDAIYTAVRRYFVEHADVDKAPVAPVKARYFPNMPRLRIIPGRGFFEVGGNGLPVTDEPLDAECVTRSTQCEGAGKGWEPK
jgi:hypothetical protein